MGSPVPWYFFKYLISYYAILTIFVFFLQKFQPSGERAVSLINNFIIRHKPTCNCDKCSNILQMIFVFSIGCNICRYYLQKNDLTTCLKFYEESYKYWNEIKDNFKNDSNSVYRKEFNLIVVDLFLDYIFILRKINKNEDAAKILNLCLKIRQSFNLDRNFSILEQLKEIELNKKYLFEDSISLPSPDILLQTKRRICLSSDSDSDKIDGKLFKEAKLVPKTKINSKKEDKSVDKILNVFKDLNLEENTKKTINNKKKSIPINACSTMIELPKTKSVAKKTLKTVISLSSSSDSDKNLANVILKSKTVARVKPVPKSKMIPKKEIKSTVIFPNNVASSTMIAEVELEISLEEIENTPPVVELLPVRKTARQRKQIVENLKQTRVTRSKAK